MIFEPGTAIIRYAGRSFLSVHAGNVNGTKLFGTLSCLAGVEQVDGVQHNGEVLAEGLAGRQEDARKKEKI
jgi:hypothetical protein